MGTLAGLTGLAGVAYPVANYVRSSSSSPTFDLLLITAWMFVALFVGYVSALLVGDLLFPAGWREVSILGRQVDVTNDDHAHLVDAATRDRTFAFSSIWVVVVLIIVSSTYFATNNFFGWYARYGYASSTLRGENTERKVIILEEMTRALDDRLVTYAQLMTEQLDSSDPLVVTQAIWSLGEVSRRMVRSIQMMNQGKKGGQWVNGLYESLQREVLPRFLKLQATGVQGVRSEALIYALASLKSEDAFTGFKAKFKSKDTTKVELLAIIKALAFMRDQGNGVPMLRSKILDEDDEIVRMSLWALGEIYGFGSGDYSEDTVDTGTLDILIRSLPTMAFNRQCVALDLLQRLRPGHVGPQLFKLFDSVEPSDKSCERREVKLKFQAPELMSKGEEFRQKVLKTLATIADGNHEVIVWMRRRSKDSTVASGLRADMEHILQVVNERRAAQ